MSGYLTYDVKGIQSFIFRIPRLRYIIGGSALIDRFDRETMINGINIPGARRIFSAGGKGAFFCENDECADRVGKEIVAKAREIGLDVKLGKNNDFCEAANCADKLYPFIPANLDGQPCHTSGLYPVQPGSGVGKDGKTHPLVEKRIYDRNLLTKRFENRLLPNVKMPPGFPKEQEFFHSVDAEEDADGKKGARSIGNRNRWAVICMDGNDMGMQFREFMKKKLGSEKTGKWIEEMSRSLDKCSVEAAQAGIQEVVRNWAATLDSKTISDSPLVLPVRPLVVGGDDIIALCHVSYAMAFVKEAARVFEETSEKEGKRVTEATGVSAWPATGGRLTLSAGILFCPVTLPLHTAIPYAETLMAGAKKKGRECKGGSEPSPSPSCLDWEQVTDGVIDTPSARRQRELRMIDQDDAGTTVELTRRPYTLDEFRDLERLAEGYRSIPATIRHSVLPGLRKGRFDRLAFYARIAKNHPTLFEALQEWPKPGGRWKVDPAARVMSTDIVDALLLLEEEHRMEKETV
jgi:hypothetical protein